MQSFTAKPTFTNLVKFFALMTLIAMVTPAFAWEIDFSRRQNDDKKTYETRLPASVLAKPEEAQKESFMGVFEVSEPSQDIVILNTDKGFVPETVRLRKNAKYKVQVVNVNDKSKNVSFILDSFSEHHATYFGQVKSFELSPKAEGIFSFQSPETGAQGKIIVYAPAPAIKKDSRTPASE
ncbi:MAG: cupredoxin domain-containing protein [Pseudobdellovibrionaceae bacterium]